MQDFKNETVEDFGPENVDVVPSIDLKNDKYFVRNYLNASNHLHKYFEW